MRNPGTGLVERTTRLTDGRMIRSVTGGSRGPLVVLEAGLGNPAATWVTVQRALSASCRTIAYDRAGLGGSDPADAPRTLENMASDAEAFLDAAGVDEPVLLVGHSWGGQLIRLVAQRSPERVLGCMPVDPTVSAVIADGQVDIVQQLYEGLEQQVLAGGRPQLLRDQRVKWGIGMPDDDLDVALADYLTLPNIRTSLREAEFFPTTYPLLQRIETTPSPVPIRYLAGTRGAADDQERQLLIDECARVAAITPGGRSVEIPDARHSIPQESPVRTAEEIIRFAQEIAG